MNVNDFLEIFSLFFIFDLRYIFLCIRISVLELRIFKAVLHIQVSNFSLKKDF